MKTRKSKSPDAVTTIATTLIALFALSGAANAAVIDFTGTVSSGGVGSPTPVEPFALGDTLSGFIEIEDAAALPGGSFDEDDLLDFSFTVGPVVFSLANSTPFGFLSGMFSADGSFLSEFNVSTNFGAYPGCAFCNLVLNAGADSFVVSVTGAQFGFAEGDDLTSTVRSMATVPEPPMVMLLGLGMVALGLTRRSRSRKST